MELSVEHFRKLLSSETNRLNELCDKWSVHVQEDQEKTEEIPDDGISFFIFDYCYRLTGKSFV